MLDLEAIKARLAAATSDDDETIAACFDDMTALLAEVQALRSREDDREDLAQRLERRYERYELDAKFIAFVRENYSLIGGDEKIYDAFIKYDYDVATLNAAWEREYPVTP